jgi:molybdate transport system substrate-binding protein
MAMHGLKTIAALAVVTLVNALMSEPARAADIKLLTAGAMKSVVVALQPSFEQQTGHRLVIDTATAGALAKRISDGEAFDVAIVTPAAIASLEKAGKIAAQSAADIAKVGIGVAVKAGAAKPDISTVEAFKAALVQAKSVAYIDPKAGGSSGIYFDTWLEKVGLADAVRAKAKLKQGGYVAELVVSGDAELAIHQISEILPVAGVTLVGPLPAEIQNYTTYTAGLGMSAADPVAGKALLDFLRSDAAKIVLKAKGMETP